MSKRLKKMKKALSESSKLTEQIKPSTLSPFRYPGGKSALRSKIITWIRALPKRPDNFLETFAGGSSIGLAIAELNLAKVVTLVEIDPEVAAVWKVILTDKAPLLAECVRKFELNEASAEEVLESRDSEIVARAFRCLLLNRIARGGIMAPGAGRLKRGENGRGIHSRWYPETLARRIESVHSLRARINFIEGDGLQVIRDFSLVPNSIAFIDPPYFAKGRGAGMRLYRHFDVDCHELFEAVRAFPGPAVITYHRSEIVQREARAAGIKCRTVNMHTAHTVSKRQLILYKDGL